MTQAQRAAKFLTAVGIANRIFRSPVRLTERGCSYGVKIYEQELSRSLRILEENDIHPIKVLRQSERGEYTEVEAS